MNYSIEIGRYRRRFRDALRTAYGVLEEREGVIVRLAGEGEVRYAEVAPFEHFGTESLSKAISYLKELGSIDRDKLQGIPDDLVSVRSGLEMAFMDLGEGDVESAGLLGGGEIALDQCKSLLTSGYRVFKWKIGCGSFKEEREIFLRLMDMLEGRCLRLDANESLSVQGTSEWLRLLDQYEEVEYLEQPLKCDLLSTMKAFQELHVTPIALDESVGSFEALKRVSEGGWKGYYIVKPSLLKDVRSFIEWRQGKEDRIVYSSLFETAVGLSGLLGLAGGSKSVHGLGTVNYFENDGFSDGFNGPLIRPASVSNEVKERLWQKTSHL